LFFSSIVYFGIFVISIFAFKAVEISSALDAENTEQDVSAAGESLENLADNDGGGESGDNNLEDIMDQHSQVLKHKYFAFWHSNKKETIACIRRWWKP
jgi:hypothetical protein